DSRGCGREAARRVLRALALPNLRVVRTSAKPVDVVHSCQHLLLTRNKWVVDIEHGQPFVGTEFSRLCRTSVRAAILTIVSSRSCRAIMPWTRTAARAFVATFGPADRVLEKIQVVYPAVPPAPPQARHVGGCRLL